MLNVERSNQTRGEGGSRPTLGHHGDKPEGEEGCEETDAEQERCEGWARERNGEARDSEARERRGRRRVGAGPREGGSLRAERGAAEGRGPPCGAPRCCRQLRVRGRRLHGNGTLWAGQETRPGGRGWADLAHPQAPFLTPAFR